MIDRDAWLAALAEVTALPAESDAVSVSEFASAMELTPTTAARRLKLLVNTQRAVKTTKRARDAAGRIVTVPAYRLVNDHAPEQTS